MQEGIFQLWGSRTTQNNTDHHHEPGQPGFPNGARQSNSLWLTPVEYGLLYHLARNAGHVLTHDALLTKVWGDEYQGESDYLKVYISRLRAKLGEDPTHPQWIETVPRLGYRFLRSPTAAPSSESKSVEQGR
jgi:DNA-binding winged helix-turn-helix (wHTH) protein